MDAAMHLTETERRDDFAWLGDVVRATEGFLDTASRSHIEIPGTDEKKFDAAKVRHPCAPRPARLPQK